mmetsp:Transcript_40267/g.107997  ORF Transcript_40267/g.107997 Transcript_40267/m.107997 type:complete len:143 (-) Transcript_40267:206-634(-)
MPGRASPDGTQLRGFTPPLPPPVHYPTPTPPPPAARASPVSRDGEDDCTAGSGAETGGDAWRRSAALEEVEQVKRALARGRIVCPVNVIERALRVPEDRSYARCVDALPRPGSHIAEDVVGGKKKKKGKKGGKKGKKGKNKK